MENPDQLLSDSIMPGNAEVAKMALARGADLNLKFGVKEKDTGLIVAIDF